MYFHYPTLFRVFRLTFSRRYFSLRHACLSVVFMSLFLLLRAFVWLVRPLDHIFFPGYRKQAVEKPVYIVGNPRSGTTFMHRLISRDKRFSYFQLYHTIFPSILFYRLFSAAGRLDRMAGGPLAGLLRLISHRGFRGWEDIHRTGPAEAESDEMLFVYAMLSPLLGLLFPFLDRLEEVKFVDRLPERKRRRLMAYYRDCLKRHLYATGPEKILLEKVALIAGRLNSIVEVLPDMRIVHLVRHPYQSIPSLVSMFQVPWKTLAPRFAKDSRACREVATMIFEYYRYLLELKRKLPEGQYMEVRYEDLVADPKGTVQGIYDKLGLEMSGEYLAVLEQETEKARRYKSTHRYTLEEFGLSRETVYEELKDVFEEYGFER